MSDLHRPENDDRPNNSAGIFGAFMALCWLVILGALSLTALVLAIKFLIWALRWSI